MQTLQKDNKLAISFGVIAVIIASGVILSLSTVSIPEHESTDTPTSGMPVPGSNIPERIVSNEDSSTSIGMPVPGNTVPEMIVNPN